MESPWVTRARENSLPSQAYAGNAAFERANPYESWDDELLRSIHEEELTVAREEAWRRAEQERNAA